MVSSDLHYLSPQLMEYRGKFREICEALGEPEMERIEEVMDGLLDKVMEKRPDIFLITGDLSYQGEKQSHMELADKLAGLCQAGIFVYVVPGNQDMDNPFSMSWKSTACGQQNTGFSEKNSDVRTDKAAYTPVPSVSAREFREIYGHMGYGGNVQETSFAAGGCKSAVISRAPDSLSYLVHFTKQQPGEWKSDELKSDELKSDELKSDGLKSDELKSELYLFMLDTTISRSPEGEISAGTLKWMKKWMKKVSQKPCIIAGHHPLLPLDLNEETRKETEKYVMKNSKQLCELMQKYRISLYCSGHLHRAGEAVRRNDAEKENRRKGCFLIKNRILKEFEIRNIFLEKRGIKELLCSSDIDSERVKIYGTEQEKK